MAFLDLDIQLEEGRLKFQTYRKAQNAYLYIPRTSCHPSGVFKALIVGEVQRLLRTCHGNKSAFAQHCSFFLDKLRQRGYSRKNAEQLAMQTVQKKRLQVSNDRHRSRKFFFKQEFSSSLNAKFINAARKRHWHVIRRCFKQPVEVILSHSVQKNMFRSDFAVNWLSASRSQLRFHLNSCQESQLVELISRVVAFPIQKR